MKEAWLLGSLGWTELGEEFNLAMARLYGRHRTESRFEPDRAARAMRIPMNRSICVRNLTPNARAATSLRVPPNAEDKSGDREVTLTSITAGGQLRR